MASLLAGAAVAAEIKLSPPSEQGSGGYWVGQWAAAPSLDDLAALAPPGAKGAFAHYNCYAQRDGALADCASFESYRSGLAQAARPLLPRFRLSEPDVQKLGAQGWVSFSIVWGEIPETCLPPCPPATRSPIRRRRRAGRRSEHENARTRRALWARAGAER